MYLEIHSLLRVDLRSEYMHFIRSFVCLFVYLSEVTTPSLVEKIGIGPPRLLSITHSYCIPPVNVPVVR